MTRYLLISLFMLGSLQGKGQVVNESLFSKMDGFPQYFLWDGTLTMLMGYSKTLGGSLSLPSPLLEFNEGDTVALSLTNFSQAAPHTIHLHGLDVDQENDGVPSLSFYVEHDSTGVYNFIAPHAGTYIYHCHVVSTLHVQAGMYGLVVIRPPDGSNTTWDGGYVFDQEKMWMMSEIDPAWHVDSFQNNPFDPMDTVHLMLDYNPGYFLINGKSENQLTQPDVSISASANENIYVRLANIGFCGNRVIFPSALNAQIVDSDGRPLPTVVNSDTVVLMPGERYGVMLTPTVEMTDVVNVEYFDLNTQIVKNTQEASVNVQGFNGFVENGSAADIFIFPNPVADEFSVVIPEAQVGRNDFIIMDMNGKIVYQETRVGNNQSTFTIDTKSWDNGLYLIQFLTQEKIYTKKIIVNH